MHLINPRIFAVLTIVLVGITNVNAQPEVVATIRPLQLIAMAVTDGVSEPSTLFDQSQDPHHPSLRPSQRKSLDNADILLWVGSALETGMEKAIRDLDSEVIAMQDMAEITRQYSGELLDPHVWLDTHNTAAIASRLANALSQMDAANSDHYQRNLQDFLAALRELESRMQALFSNKNNHAYAVYHNGYQYFEKQFGLEHAASFTDNDEIRPGIRHILMVKSTLEKHDVNCILAGPSVNTDQLANQLGRQDIRFVEIDILAHDTEGGKEGYLKFLEDVAAAFHSCLN